MNNDLNLTQVPEVRSPFWWLRWVPTAVISVIILYFLYVAGGVALVPVMASVALAYLLNPLVYRGERLGLSRPISAVAAILLVSIAIAAFMAYVIPELWAQGSNAGKKIAASFTPENAARQREALRRYSPALEKVAGDRIEKFLSDPLSVANEAATTTTVTGPDGTTQVSTASGPSVVISTLVYSLDLLLIPFFVFYILIDFPKWRDLLEELIPPRFRVPFSRLFDESGRILESYVRGQLLVGLIMAVFYGLGFWLLGVPAWAGIALLAGLLNAIPYVGTLLGLGLAGGFTIANGGGVWDLAAVVGVFVAVQTLEAYVLTPRIIGGRLNLHPMAVFLALLIGGKLFGLLGIVIAIPTVAIGKVFLKFLRELYQASYFYHAGDHHPLDAPSENIEDRLHDAADAVLADQLEKCEEGADNGASDPLNPQRQAKETISPSNPA
jgi:predicted PurR-regulated permease PerM